jgi:hypothetical protein
MNRSPVLKTGGEKYAIRVLGAESVDEKSLGGLCQVAKRLTNKKGGLDAS